MTKRQQVPRATQDAVLVASRRRCCICFAVRGDTSEKAGQIAHLDGDRSNNSFENLSHLCLEHHDQFDSRTSQSKGLTVGEVKEYRAQLYEYVESSLPVSRSSPDEPMDKSEESGLTPGLFEIVEQQTRPESEQGAQIDLGTLSSELGISQRELMDDLKAASDLLLRIDDANLSGTQARILATVAETSGGSSVPRRVVESAARFDYRSSEFHEEMTVLEFHGLVAFTDDPDGEINLGRGDSESWQLLIYLAELTGQTIEEIIRYPNMDSLISDIG